MADWNGFKKNGTTYTPNDSTARGWIGTLSNLTTTVKTNIVAAINELVTSISTINGKIPSGASSSNKMATASDVAGKVGWSDAEKYVGYNICPYPYNGTRQLIGTDGTITDNAEYYLSDFVDVDGISSVKVSVGSATGSLAFRIATYDSSKNFIERIGLQPTSLTPVTQALGSTVKYVRFCFEDTSSKNYTQHMVVNSELSNLPYTPYIPNNTELMTWEANAKTGVHQLLNNEGVSGTYATVTITTLANKSFTVNGTAGGNNASYQLMRVTLPKGRYTLSKTGRNDGYYQVVNDAESQELYAAGVNDALIDLSEDTVLKIRFRMLSGAVFNNETFNPLLKLEDDPINTPAPYAMTNEELTNKMFPRSEQAVLGAHNNIIREEGSITRHGVTFTVNADETVTANNTATAEARLEYGYIIYNPGDSLEISGVTNGSYQTYYIGYVFKNEQHQYISEDSVYNGKKVITVPANTKYIVIYCVVQNGYSANNVLFSPLVKFSDDSNDIFSKSSPSNAELAVLLRVEETDVITENEHITLDSSIKKVYTYGRIAYARVRFTLDANSGTGTNVLFKLPHPALATYPLLPITMRSSPFAVVTDCSPYIDGINVVLLGYDLPAGTYDMTFSYIIDL